MEPFKTCTKCGIEKPFSEFPLRNNRNGMSSRQPYCRECHAKCERKRWNEKLAVDPEFRSKRIVRGRVAYGHKKAKSKCHSCECEADDGQVYCEKHRKARAMHEAEFRASLPPKLCRICGKEQPKPGRLICDSCASPERRREYVKQWNREQKRIAFEHYGGVRCACCGETNPGFLTMDHIAEDGAVHRKKIFAHTKDGRGRIYNWLKKNGYPIGFQVLCFNCNCGRAYNGGICPHKIAEAAA